MEQKLIKFLNERQENGLLRTLVTAQDTCGGSIEIDGRKYINFSSNDYLGLSNHPDMLAAAKKVLDSTFGSASSRLMTGTTGLHAELEDQVARFKEKPSAIVYNSGYQANVGVISSLCGRDDAIFSDKLNHASIVDGITLSRGNLFRFKHNDAEHLKYLLDRERDNYKNAFIVNESVYSMDGDIAPMKDIAGLKRKYECMWMVDEAHATGVFGKNGRGIIEETGTADDVDLAMGTFSKALGGFGAYIAAADAIRSYLINTSRSFIYSTSLPPAIIAGNIAALKIVDEEPVRRDVLLKNSGYLRDSLKGLGLKIAGESQIIPVILGDNLETLRLSDYLRSKGLWVTPVRPPTVPQGESRIRISLSYDHKKEDIDKLIDGIKAWINR